LTCLVAMDDQSSSASGDGGSKKDASAEEGSGEPEDERRKIQTETEIKLPVLLNLALAALKLGMLSKAERFCNFAMEMDSGKRSVKAHFRRGRVRMLMGHYVGAELDLDKALELIDDTIISDSEDGDTTKETENERAVIRKEKHKLNRLVNRAEKNKRQQKKAMEKLFKSEEKKAPEPIISIQQPNDHQDSSEDPPEECRPTCFQWYLQTIGRCAQKLLDIIGDGERDEEDDDDGLVDVPVDQELLKRLMEEKQKND